MGYYQKIYFLGFTGDIDVINWMDEEAIEKLKEDREPFEAPTSHYIPKPEERGKLLWFSGKVLHTVCLHILFMVIKLKVHLELESQQQLDAWPKNMDLFTMKPIASSCFVIHSLIQIMTCN